MRHLHRAGHWRRLWAAALCVIVLLTAVLTPALAQNAPRTLRVGAFPYEELRQVDAFGNATGYGHDYLQEIARYTGWKFEFVDAPWDTCLAMLERGELDLMGAVMHSDDRAARFDFSQYPMLSGYGVLATSLSNELLPYEDFAAFDGLRVGVIAGSQQADSFLSYGRIHGFAPVLHQYDTQAQVEKALASGQVEAIIATNLLRSDQLRVVATFGENDAFFVTTQGRDDILSPLNEAMRQIRLHDPYFNGSLDQKYFDIQTSTAISFTREELDFLRRSDPISCAYIPGVPPFSTFDRASGSVQGLAVDLLSLLTERTGLQFQWRHPKNASEAASLLGSGEVQLLVAKHVDWAWAAENHARFTTPYLQSQMVLVTGRSTATPDIVAVYDQPSQGALAAEALPPGAQLAQYASLTECMDAVLRGQATATFVNSTIASYLLNDARYADLQAAALYGSAAQVAMAVNDRVDPLLLSVLNKALRSISATEHNQSLLRHLQREQVSPLIAHLHQHPVEIVLLVASGFVLLISILLVALYRMYRMLYLDPLTGHRNFRWLSRRAARLLAGQTEQYALVYLDIRRFKVINDTFGYLRGDQVLIAVSHALQAFIRRDERMARVHADTFVLLLRHQGHDQLAERLQELCRQLELPFAQSSVNPLFRGGVYLLSEGYENLERACDRANYAKDSIRHLFSNTFALYDDVIHSRVLAEKELEDSMHIALARREFVPHYQPKINAITNQVIGAEALVRWHHPEKGCLSPGDFIPFYEENGFIVEIDLAVFEQVCEDLHQWLQAGRPVVPISVNFSRRNFQNKELPRQLMEIAASHGIPTSLLEIEVTETEELENLDIAVDFVSSLKAFGFHVSIDDYGTGYSSISFLQQLPLDTLKLDRRFILNAMLSGKARDIMLHLVSAMQKNQIRILCEGVETQEQLTFVIGLNCRFIQGFFYSTPLQKDEFEAYLAAHGVDTSGELDTIPIVDFTRADLGGMEDFLTKAMPSWVFSCYQAPGYPIAFVSESLLAALGYGRLEFHLATDGLYEHAIHPDDVQAALTQLEPHVTRQYRLRKRDGDYLWVREVNRRVLNMDGRELLLGVCTDITDMIALQNEKGRLLSAIPGGVAELRLQEDAVLVQQASPRFYEIIGHTQQELHALDSNLLHIFTPESLLQAQTTLHRILSEGQTACECVFQLRHRDGALHWVTFFSTVDPLGRLVTTVIRNSDDEVEARQRTEIERTKLELALSLAEQAVFEYDLQSNTVRTHFGFAAFGVPDGTVMPMVADSLPTGVVHPEDLSKLPIFDAALATTESPPPVELRVHYQGSPDQYDWVRITMSAVPNPQGRPQRIIGIVENITLQKRFTYAFQQEAQFRRAFTESSLMAYEINLTRDTVRRICGSRGFRLEEISQALPHPACYSQLNEMAVPLLVAQEDRQHYAQAMSTEHLLALYRSSVFEQELEYRRITPEGQVMWNAALVRLLMDQLSGDIICYVYHRDISQRKLAEATAVPAAAMAGPLP